MQRAHRSSRTRVLVSVLFRSVPIDQCAFLCATGSCEEAKLLHQADQWASGMRAPRGSGALLGPITLLRLLIAASAALPAHFSAEPFAGKDWNASVTVDVGRKKPISPMLYGIFFEEIGHAGEGGLYAELVQDRSFDAIAAATGFHASPARRTAIDLAALAAAHRRADQPLPMLWKDPQGHNITSKADYSRQMRDEANWDPRNDITIAWEALPGTTTALTKEQPLNARNPVAMELTAGPGPRAGIVNFGYWGVFVQKDHSYTVTLHARTSDKQAKDITVALVSEDQATSYANVTLSGVSGDWQQLSGELVSSTTDSNARLAVLFKGGDLILDSVSLFPTENVKKGKGMANPWPFRADLLGALKALQPAFMRFPGGCYVEGNWMRNAFRWKDSVGRNEERPGHLNDVWGYWSTDGLGLFEYMMLAEELGAEPVWVINNGVAHSDSVHAADVWPMVQEALDSLEFISGPPDSKWGSVRASMGRSEPWSINYMAIGNEDCGRPFYVNNYLLFFGALRARYPHLTLISNCHMGQDAPTDTWDWHIYTNPSDMFNKRTFFDGWTVEKNARVFASEYAVTEGGGWGNVAAAVSEAAFMTGMERNGEVVVMGAYAPLFVHWNNRLWPTNLIVIDNHRWFGIPSYHVQRMFRQYQGTHYIATDVFTNPAGQVHEDKVAASATCQSPSCDRIALKIVNFSSFKQRIAVLLHGASAASVMEEGELECLASDHPEAENSFDKPDKVAPSTSTVDGLGPQFVLPVEPWSVNVLQVHLSVSPSAAGQAGAEAVLFSSATGGQEGVAAV
ncbi:hypothetical protein ABPG77_006364 [Micractinium sp. CCAP 211/92]